MARKPRDMGKPVVVAATPEKYDMVTSQRALIKNGFHPAVTSKSPSEIESEWGMKLRHLTQKPSKSEFEAYAPFRYLTTVGVPLFMYIGFHLMLTAGIGHPSVSLRDQVR